MASFSSRRPIIYGIPGSSDLRKTYTASVANFLGLQNTKSQVEMDARVCSDALNVYVDSDYRLCTRKRLANKLRQTTEFSVIEAVNIGETVYAIIQKTDSASFFLNQIYPKYEQYSDRLTQSSKLFVVNQKLYVTGVSVENEEQDRFGLFFLKDNQLVSIVDSAYIPNFTLDSNRKYSSGDSANIFSSKFKLGDNTSFTPEDITSKIPRDLRGNTQNYATFEATGYSNNDRSTAYVLDGDKWVVWKYEQTGDSEWSIRIYETSDPLTLGSPVASTVLFTSESDARTGGIVVCVSKSQAYVSGNASVWTVYRGSSGFTITKIYSGIQDINEITRLDTDNTYVLIVTSANIVVYNPRPSLDVGFKTCDLAYVNDNIRKTARILYPFIYWSPDQAFDHNAAILMSSKPDDPSDTDWVTPAFYPYAKIDFSKPTKFDDLENKNTYIAAITRSVQRNEYLFYTGAKTKNISGEVSQEFIWNVTGDLKFKQLTGSQFAYTIDPSCSKSVVSNITGIPKQQSMSGISFILNDAPEIGDTIIAMIDTNSVLIKNLAVNAVFSCSIPFSEYRKNVPGKTEVKDKFLTTVYRDVRIRVLAEFDNSDTYSFDDVEILTKSTGQIYYDWVKAREKIGKIDGVYTMNNFIIFTCGNHFVYSSSFDSTFAPVDNVNSLRDNDSSIVDILVISPTAALLFTKETTYWLLGSGEGDLTYCNPVVSQFTLNDVTRFASVKLALRDTPCVMARDGIMAFSDSSEVTETAKNITNMSEPVIDKYLNMIRTPGERMAFRGIWFNIFANVTSRESYMLFYDARTSSWWYWHMPISIRHMFMYADEFYVVDGSGNVYYLTDKSKLDDRNLLRTYNDELPSGDAKIFWFIRSHPMSLGAVTRGKQIKKVILSLVPDTLVGEITPDDPNYDDVGSLNSSSVTGREIRNFEIRVNLIPYASVDLISRRGMISDVVRQLDISELRMFVPKFNYVSYDLASSTSPLKYDKLTLSSISFLYQILDKLS